MPKQRERNSRRLNTNISTSQQKEEGQQQQEVRRFAIKLAWDGTSYHGFQSQPYKNTIQDNLESRLRGLLRRPVRIIAWGRTDSGVHAKGAVVTLDLSMEEIYKFANSMKKCPKKEEDEEEEITESSALKAASQFLHSVLKEFACNTGRDNCTQQLQRTRYGSITALSVTSVSLDFDARYSALWKRYVYYICATGDNDNGDNQQQQQQQQQQQLPFVWNRYAWIVKKSLDYSAMAKAAELLSNTPHDFEWMCIIQEGELRDTCRTVQLRVEQVSMNEESNINNNIPYFLQQHEKTVVYKVTVQTDFFLYKMVRRIVGILVSIGKHDVDLDTLKVCLDEHDERYNNNDDDDARNNNTKNQKKTTVPTKLLLTAPAKGLCLDHIEYNIQI